MNTSEKARARETALKLVSYFDRLSTQAWAQKGEERAFTWLRFIEQERPDTVEIQRLLATLEAGSADGGSAWDEMLVRRAQVGAGRRPLDP